jgi:hypothetical protein
MKDRRTSPRSGSGPWRGHGGLADDIRKRFVRSELEGGVRIACLDEGSHVFVETVNRIYDLEVRGGQMWISGHPEFCPRPVPVKVHGSSWGGSMLKVSYLGCGMHMEFEHPTFATITTSRIVSIRTA